MLESLLEHVEDRAYAVSWLNPWFWDIVDRSLAYYRRGGCFLAICAGAERNAMRRGRARARR
jgi:glutamine amidotransferase-like uncharacterized protein